MSKARLMYASIWAYNIDKKPTLTVELDIGGKEIRISDMPVSNEMMKELVATFKRHLPKPEDI